MVEGTANFTFEVPPEIAGGTYANMLNVWHSPYELTLDFSVTDHPVETPNGLTVPCRVVARVKLPPTQAFAVIKALNANLTMYEEKFGPIKEPGPDGPDPRLNPPGVDPDPGV